MWPIREFLRHSDARGIRRKMAVRMGLTCTLVLVATVVASAENNDNSVASDLAHLMENLVTLDNTELIVLSDFVLPEQIQLLRLLNEAELPFYSYEISNLRTMQQEMSRRTPCPVFGKPSPENVTEDVPADQIYMRRQQILPTQKYHRSMFVWADEPEMVTEAVKILDESVMDCQQRKDPGLYHSGNRIYFLADKNVLLRSANAAKHSHTAAVERVGKGAFAFWSYDFGAKKDGVVALNYIWKRGERIRDLSVLFTEAGRFRGRSLRVSAMPWAWFIVADELTAEEGRTNTRRYKNYWGVEVTLVSELAKKLNFDFAISNPADGQWGVICESGTWTGMVGEVARGTADVAVADILVKFDRSQVTQTSFPYGQEFLTFASPPPREAPKYFSFLRPLSPEVWLHVVLCVFIAGAAMFAVARVEVMIVRGISLKEWITIENATWYTFGTLMGESITRDTKTARSWALRFLVMSWLLFCLIVSASYGGNLKAYLTTPVFTEPIKTVEAILESGLPWRMALFGAEFEAQMEKTENPTLKALWEGKTPVAFGPAAELEDVYGGRAVTFDYLTAIQAPVYTKYSTPDGRPLIHISSKPVFGNDWVGLYLGEINPWKERFDQVIMTFIEAGLMNKWQLETLLRMRAESGEEAAAMASNSVDGSGRSEAFVLDDLKGIFFTVLVGLPISAIVFACEKFFSAEKMRRLHERSRITKIKVIIAK